MVDFKVNINDDNVLLINLEKILEVMKNPTEGIEVKSRTIWFSCYKNCFSAKEAIDWLVKVGEARTREEAVEKGQEMLQRILISPINGTSNFSDDRSLYFHLIPSDISQIVREMIDWETGVTIQTRHHKWWYLPNSFTGSDAVNWLQERYKISEAEAIQIGQSLIDYHIVSPITHNHSFRNEPLFYTFPCYRIYRQVDAPPTSYSSILQGLLASPHSNTFNCVSTQAEPSDTLHRAKEGPLIIPNRFSMEEVKFILKSIMCEYESTLQNEGEWYLHYVVKVGMGGWTDDVEFLINRDSGEVHYRSASRVGIGDMGVNQKRVTRINELWTHKISETNS